MSGNLTPSNSINDIRTQSLGVLAERLANIDLTQLLVYVISNSPESALPFLAWQFDVLSPFWQLLSPGASQAALVEQSISLHRVLGTPHSITQSLGNLGWGYVTIREGQNSWGGNSYPLSQGWAVFRVYINKGTPNLLQPDTPYPQVTNTCVPTNAVLPPTLDMLTFQHTRGNGPDTNCGAIQTSGNITGETISGGAWVYIPNGWSGTSVQINIEGGGLSGVSIPVYANLSITGQWQQLTVSPSGPVTVSAFLVIRIIDSNPNDVVYSAGWFVEEQPELQTALSVNTTQEIQALDAINFFKPARSVLDGLWFVEPVIQEPDISIVDRFTLTVGPIQVEPNIVITDTPFVVGWTILDTYTLPRYHNGFFYFSKAITYGSSFGSTFISSGPINVNGQVVTAS